MISLGVTLAAMLRTDFGGQGQEQGDLVKNLKKNYVNNPGEK